MEKICIVKLRKKMTDPIPVEGKCGQGSPAREDGMVKGLSLAATDNSGMRGVDDESAGTNGKKDNADRSISLLLNQEQMRALRSNPHMVSFLSAEPTEGLEATNHRDETMVIKFEFESIPPVQLLKVEEVIHMLRISKGYLKKLVSQGKLKSYKLGRLRRIMLDDVLSYLEDSQECTDIRQQPLKSGISHKGIL
ncbi:MAG: helix-turn-helix domain-containing protein [Nitrospirota bacterium]